MIEVSIKRSLPVMNPFITTSPILSCSPTANSKFDCMFDELSIVLNFTHKLFVRLSSEWASSLASVFFCYTIPVSEARARLLWCVVYWTNALVLFCW